MQQRYLCIYHVIAENDDAELIKYDSKNVNG